MKKKQSHVTPEWVRNEPAAHSFRSIFKWGAKNRFKDPAQGFLKVIKQALELTDTDFKHPVNTGNVPVDREQKTNLSLEDIHVFEGIVGPDNVASDTYSRLKFSTGKSMEDILNLRQGRVDQISDAVLHPRNKEEIEKVVTYCHEKKIALHVYGGGSSVTLGLACPRGGVTLVMATHMHRVIEFNEVNQTITVEAGMMGPEYEALLNRAKENFNAQNRYTGGHFPQSFEHSSVGGWIVTLGSGQASSYYGDACDLVVSQTYVTPRGTFKTLPFPATATGPKLNDIMKGSEGCFGVLVALTLKIFPHTPETARPFSFMFPSFGAAMTAARKISQAGGGMPSVLRVSDPEETDVAMKMYDLSNGIIDRFLILRGLNPGKRCLLMGQTDGEKRFSNTLFRRVKKLCRDCQGVYLTAYPTRKWQKGRFSDPYMRDALNDFGVLIDTLETAVTWEALPGLYQAVRDHIKGHPNTICMTHASHFYAQGTNLYFIFITRMRDIEAFRTFQSGIIDTIHIHSGSLSHHHGVGRMLAPWMAKHLGEQQMAVLRAIKNHFDPHQIMNPGGLGL